MDIQFISLQPATIGLILSDDNGEVIQDKILWGDRYGTAASLQGRKGGETQPPPLYDPVLNRIETALNYDPENLIVDGMEETYDFILDHQIREFMHIWDRSDDASRAILISKTSVAVPLRIL